MTETAILEFGATDTAHGLIKLELNDIANNEKTVFLPGETVDFLLHVESSLEILDIKPTSGAITPTGPLSQQREEWLLFTFEKKDVDLSYFPAENLEKTWYGNDANPTLSGRTMNGNEVLPAFGLFIYNVNFLSFKYTPPGMELSGDDEYPVRIVVRYKIK